MGQGGGGGGGEEILLLELNFIIHALICMPVISFSVKCHKLELETDMKCKYTSPFNIGIQLYLLTIYYPKFKIACYQTDANLVGSVSIHSDSIQLLK